MAKLPTIDVAVIWIRDLLHRGQRDEALAKLQKSVESGKAGKDTRALAEYLKSAKRGRQPFGATHLWMEIGVENDDLRDAGLLYEERMAQLGTKYMIRSRQVETAVAKFEEAIEAIRKENEAG